MPYIIFHLIQKLPNEIDAVMVSYFGFENCNTWRLSNLIRAIGFKKW